MKHFWAEMHSTEKHEKHATLATAQHHTQLSKENFSLVVCLNLKAKMITALNGINNSTFISKHSDALIIVLSLTNIRGRREEERTRLTQSSARNWDFSWELLMISDDFLLLGYFELKEILKETLISDEFKCNLMLKVHFERSWIPSIFQTCLTVI